MLVREIRTCFKEETRVVCGRNMVRPSVFWDGFFIAADRSISRQEKGGNV